MTALKRTFGNLIDPNFRASAQLQLVYVPKLVTVQDLLSALPGCPYFSMLQTTAGHLSNFLNVPLNELSIESVQDLGDSFRLYLQERRFKPNAIRSYSNFAAMLLRKAKELGWTPQRTEVSDGWLPIASALPKDTHCGTIIRYAIRHQIAASRFSDKDLKLWGDELLKWGRSYDYVRKLKAQFRRFILTNGLSAHLPLFNCCPTYPSRYGVALSALPDGLRCEVEALIEWKVKLFAEGRPKRSRLRAISADVLQQLIGRIYGFAKNIQKRTDISELLDIINPESISSYVDWYINKRGLRSRPLISCLGLLCAALRCPRYKAHEFTWLRTLILQIEPDSESEKRERKGLKYLDYEVLEEIPIMIHARRGDVGRHGAKQLALLIRDELLLSWLVTLVWRQRNIRECRLGHNLFKAPISSFVDIAIPNWAREQLKANPDEQFWQFHFRENETKTKHEVRAILPRKLVSLLEEYLEHYRPLLIRGSDPGTLFLNSRGGALTREEVTYLVSNLTWRYAYKRVTPHVFRDIFAYYWLDHHPEDYLTVSKVLWHRSIKTTLETYGCRFDESHGLRRVEEWLDSRGGKHEFTSRPAPDRSSSTYEETRPRVGANCGPGIQPKSRFELDFGRNGGKGSAA